MKSKNTEAVGLFSPMGGVGVGWGGGWGVKINMPYTAGEESACSEVANASYVLILIYLITWASVGF